MTMDLPPTPAPATNPVAPAAAAVTAAPAPVVRAGRSSNRLLDVALAAAAALAIGGVAFGVGRATAPTVPAGLQNGVALPGGNFVRPNGSFDPGAGPRGGLGFAGGPAIDGTVTAVDANKLIVKLANGQDITFTLDPTTTYHQASSATAADVAVGDDVSVRVSGGGRFQVGAGQSAAPSANPGLSASDVTVRR
jgi:hypothetical protein